METFYLVDFENVHNEGLENIAALKRTEHVHIFFTENANSIRLDIAFPHNIDVNGHMVPACKQSLDMHLVSYLGYLLGVHGKECSYIIISKDKDYDNIIKFWKKEGWLNISRKTKILETAEEQKKNASSSKVTKRETELRSLFDRNLKQKIYIDYKEELIKVILNAKTKQILNNGLTKLYTDGNALRNIYQAIQPFIKDLPGK